MSLSYVAIYSPRLGATEETLSQQLLFYYSSQQASNIDTQLRNIGLVQGILEFGRSFSVNRRNGESAWQVEVIKGKDTRNYVYEIENDFWLLASFNLDQKSEPAKKVTNAQKGIPDAQILAQIKHGYDMFSIENGRFSRLLETGRDAATKVIESWWLRWSYEWTVMSSKENNFAKSTHLLRGSDTLFDGYRVSLRQLRNKHRSELLAITDQLRLAFPDDFVDLLLCSPEGVIVPPQSLTPRSCNQLWKYVSQNIYDSHSVREGYSQSLESTLTTESANHELVKPILRTQDSARTIRENVNGFSEPQGSRLSSWLTAKTWSSSTRNLLSAVSAKVGFGVGETADEIMDDSEQEQDETWKWFGEREKSLYLYHTGKNEMSQCRVSICQKDRVDFIILSPDIKRKRDEFVAFFESSITNFLSHAQYTKPKNIPFSYLVFNSAKQTVHNAMPNSSSCSMPGLRDELIVHLHHAISALHSKHAPHRKAEELIRTTRNLWLSYKKSHDLEIILTRAARTGESLEDVALESRTYSTFLQQKTVEEA